jgi:hypothetical protein
VRRHDRYGYTGGIGKGVTQFGIDPALRVTGAVAGRTSERPTTPLRQQPLVGALVREKDVAIALLQLYHPAWRGPRSTLYSDVWRSVHEVIGKLGIGRRA